jgi:nucleoside-diphosphate-sugar epimerase
MDINQHFNAKNVLLTGGLGFIGSNLAIALVESGANVTVIDSLIPEYGGNLWNVEPIKNNLRINISDVRDEHAMKYLIQGQDYLFNLAGQTSHADSMINPFTDLEINSHAQLSILEACRKHNPDIKVIFASTRQIYGKPSYLPVDERHALQPIDVNGINKMSGEWYHLVYNNVYGIRTAVLRLTNTYGPRMRVKDERQTFLGIWIKSILEEKPIFVFGDGKQIRDFNFVDDVVNAFLLAAHSDDADGQIFNMGADDPISLKDTAELLRIIRGKGTWQLVPFPSERKVIDIGDYYGDYRKIRAMLGWTPKTSLKEGLDRTLAYYEQYHSKYWD